MAHPAHPAQLGRFRIRGVLGEGAMGVVYLGHDPHIDRQVAIKTMRVGASEDAGPGVSYADRFRNEARAAGRLQHPGIVAVYDVGRDDGVDFIAMEYVRGNTLSRYIAQSVADALPINDDDAASIIGQLLEALDHAHRQGVLHRDIKPSNLILTPDGKVKVSDFGIARIESAELTQVASLIGTPAYMAPERFQGKPIDRRVDLYAAGVVLYQMLTGRVPFSGAPEAIMFKAVHEPLVLPSRLPGLHHLAPWDEIVARAMAKEPAQRYGDAGQFMDGLEATLGRLHPDTVSEGTITALMPRPALRSAGEAATAGSAPHGSSALPAHFSADDLAQVVARLGRHIGPMAQVLVRRVARDCPDLTTLHARLAEQLTDPAARLAFQQEVKALATGTGRGGTTSGAGGSRSTAVPAGAPATATSTLAQAPVSPALADAAQRLLAREVGPIAALLVKKALAAAPQREAFLQRLAGAVDDPAARARLLAAFKRLPD